MDTWPQANAVVLDPARINAPTPRLPPPRKLSEGALDLCQCGMHAFVTCTHRSWGRNKEHIRKCRHVPQLTPPAASLLPAAPELDD
jgi:hypothetical protein